MGKRSTYSNTQFANVAQIKNFRSVLRSAGQAIEEAAQRVSPEFGAYMNYSFFLEVGTKRMEARPHIIPAVYATAGQLLDGVGASLLAIMQQATQNKVAINSQQAIQLYSSAWIGMLNGPTRQYAVQMCTELGAVQYGFHRRSIHGYAYPRSTQEIMAEQMKSSAEREARATKDATRRKAKAALARHKKQLAKQKAAAKKKAKAKTTKKKKKTP